jgi:hypothetical protein
MQLIITIPDEVYLRAVERGWLEEYDEEIEVTALPAKGDWLEPWIEDFQRAVPFLPISNDQLPIRRID